jgi:hypothetical protein
MKFHSFKENGRLGCDTVQRISPTFRRNVLQETDGFCFLSSLLGYLFDPEDEVSIFLRNVVNLLPDYMASHPEYGTLHSCCRVSISSLRFNIRVLTLRDVCARLGGVTRRDVSRGFQCNKVQLARTFYKKSKLCMYSPVQTTFVRKKEQSWKQPYVVQKKPSFT